MDDEGTQVKKTEAHLTNRAALAASNSRDESAAGKPAVPESAASTALLERVLNAATCNAPL
ncbi:MAG: hypothetical protein KF778_09825 [Rhodocyclaceae bacterium]|nr:hypothetical protein [Rhodocyclaceae bacterium]